MKKSKNQTVVLSLGGSLIAPDQVDVVFLRKFRNLILKKKDTRFIIVCGGGMTCRRYQSAAKKLGVKRHTELDWIGIKATRLNAELVRTIFGKEAHAQVVGDPSKKVKTDRRIIIGAGFEPGCSSDLDAVLLAKAFKAKTLINLSNITHAYTKDPRKFKSAQKITCCMWDEFQRVVGTKWIPGGNFPFDPKASILAKNMNLKVIIAKGSNLANLNKILSNKAFVGTQIGPE